jgi:hypothetical protein
MLDWRFRKLSEPGRVFLTLPAFALNGSAGGKGDRQILRPIAATVISRRVESAVYKNRS